MASVSKQVTIPDWLSKLAEEKGVNLDNILTEALKEELKDFLPSNQYGIEGYISTDVDEDTFWTEFTMWLTSKGWTFGGTTWNADDEKPKAEQIDQFITSVIHVLVKKWSKTVKESEQIVEEAQLAKLLAIHPRGINEGVEVWAESCLVILLDPVVESK